MAEAECYQHYQVLKREDGSLWELGRGAMGITYKAFDTNLRCPVALKVINNAYLESEVARHRFLREARAAAALRHQNVASVFHLGTDHDSYFYAMEFIDGETVDACMKRRGRLDPAEALGVTLQVSRALAAAAKQQLVHRDLKPANLMLVDEDGDRIVKVIDFGLAKSAKREGEDSGTLTHGGGFVGTPHFASPEQLEERDIDIRSDIYSLGATLYYMLSGRPPFSGSVAQIMSQHLYKPIPLEPLQGLPPCVTTLIQRMMDKDREKRFQTPLELRQAILSCLEQIRVPLPNNKRDGASSEEPPETLATLDLGSSIQPPLIPGSTIARNYRLTKDLGDEPQGQKFLARDLRQNREVTLLVFSREFLSDVKRYTALEQAIDQLRNAPHPALRQVYSLESVDHSSFLVEEHIVGPNLLDILRTRSVLSAQEVVRVLGLLAPVADHAQINGQQYVDFTLSGIQLTYPGLTEESVNSELMLRPLTSWDPLIAKVAAIDFSLSPPDTSTWAGSATLVQSPAGGGPRGSYVRLISLLGYELLGGPRPTVETTGRYTPVAALSEEGNSVLRRGFVDQFSSVTEMVAQLGRSVVTKDTPILQPSGTRASAASLPPPVPPCVLPKISSGAPTVPPFVPPSAAATPKKASSLGLIFVLALVVALVAVAVFGGYRVYQFFVQQSGPLTRLVPTPTPVPTPIKQVSPAPPVVPEATPVPSAIPSPTPEVSASPIATPEVSPRGAQTPESTASPIATPEVSATPLPTPVPTPSPTAPAQDQAYAQTLDHAQDQVRSGAWKDGFKTYASLLDTYPSKEEPRQRLENLLGEARSDATRLNQATFSELEPGLERAAKAGVVQAMMVLGEYSRESNPEKALEWYQLAADKGNVQAMDQAGLLFATHKNPEDERKAVDYFTKAADGGDRTGKYLAGECYYFGKGVAPDQTKALSFLREAAALREPRAMDLLGTHFRHQKQYEQARHYYEEAAANGYALSLSNLGVLYMNGEGVTRNPEAAANLFRQGAEKGDSVGMLFYANCLAQGIGVQRDARAATDWYRKAAKAGNARAIDWCRQNGVSFQ
ncbi:MAG: protein kinase [Chthoniobacterales bacterium]